MYLHGCSFVYFHVANLGLTLQSSFYSHFSTVVLTRFIHLNMRVWFDCPLIMVFP